MDIDKILDKWQDMDTEDKKQAFLSQAKADFRALSKEDKDKFASDFFKAADKEIARGEEILEMIEIKNRLNDVIPFINISEVAKRYFHKSANWLYQRLNGYVVNGKPARFTDDERETLRYALNDISKTIQEASARI